MIPLERQSWEDAQYLRQKSLEISGRSRSVSDKGLEEVVCKVITKAGVDINANDIEDCRRRNKG